VDTDNNGIPDGWEELYGAAVADTDGDGLSGLAEYIAGTRPDLRTSTFNVNIELADPPPQAQVYFFALRTDGIGYEGRARYYTLEQRASLAAGAWEVVSNYNRLLGNNQWVVYTPSISNPPAFYRARVWLEGP